MHDPALRLLALLCCLIGHGSAMRRLPTYVMSHAAAPMDAEGQRGLREDADDGSRGTDAPVTDDLVTTPMPGLEGQIELVHHAGRIPLDKNKKNQIFYWHFAAATNPDKAPLLIWLNGGPGCSSMQGLMLGISPLQIVDETTIKVNPHSWHHHTNLLFIDQPVGTGMSYSRGNEYRTDEETVAKDFYAFLTKFLKIHPEYLRASTTGKARTSRDLYIFGESHAGRFIPQFSEHIVNQNKLSKDDAIRIQLKGIGIGNGWVHPYIQYDYSEFAHGLGLVTFGQVRSLKAEYVDCKNALQSGKFLSDSCFQNMNGILDGLKNTRSPSSKALNFYDVRQYVDNIQAYPPQRHDVGEYLNQMTVRRALHANTESTFRFKDCSDAVYDGLRNYDGVSTLANVQRLLDGGLQVLFYNGQWDMMCNHYATEKLLLHLDWPGATSYQEAKKYTWSVDGRTDPAGFAQQGGNLTYVVIPGAGHMVPMDVPDVATEMVRRFIHQLPFDDSLQTVKSLRTNRTNLETTQCEVVDSSITSRSPIASPRLTWLWVTLVVGVVGSLLVFCVTVMCARGKKARRSTHSVIVQESDDEEDVEQRRHEGDDDVEDDPESDEEISIRSRA